MPFRAQVPDLTGKSFNYSLIKTEKDAIAVIKAVLDLLVPGGWGLEAIGTSKAFPCQ